MIRTLSSSGSVRNEFTTQLFFDQAFLNALAITVLPYRLLASRIRRMR